MDATEENKFVCITCASEFARETVGRECGICHFSDCNDCLGEHGECIPCGK